MNQEGSATLTREETVTPSQGSSVVPATAAEAEEGGRREVGMVEEQTGARGGSASLVGAGAGV